MTDETQIIVLDVSTEDLHDPTHVGASADQQTLRLWIATEAQSVAKTRIDAQMKLLERYMARGASFVGWGLSATIALSALWRIKDHPDHLWIPAALTALASTSSALLLWPSGWQIAGDLPSYLSSTGYETELEIREALAQRDEQGIELNDRRLGQSALLLKITLCLMTLAALSVTAIFLL